jgi:HEAT repeat protein
VVFCFPDGAAAAKGALPALTRTAADKNGRNRPAVIDAVSRVGAGDPTLVPTLAPLLLDPDAKVRAAAAPALDRVDPKWRTKPAAKALQATARGQLTATDAGKRAGAADAVGLLGAGDPALVPILCPVLLDTEPPVRAAAGAALDRVDPEWREKPGAKQATAAAVKQLASPDARKRFDAVGALEIIRPASAAAPLEQLVAREADGNTERYAEQVLARLRKTP